MQREEMLGELREADELLRSVSIARLAYNGSDGSPRVIPVGFYWTGEELVVCTAPTWARDFDFGSGRLPRFLSELVGSG